MTCHSPCLCLLSIAALLSALVQPCPSVRIAVDVQRARDVLKACQTAACLACLPQQHGVIAESPRCMQRMPAQANMRGACHQRTNITPYVMSSVYWQQHPALPAVASIAACMVPKKIHHVCSADWPRIKALHQGEESCQQTCSISRVHIHLHVSLQGDRPDRVG